MATAAHTLAHTHAHTRRALCALMLLYTHGKLTRVVAQEHAGAICNTEEFAESIAVGATHFAAHLYASLTRLCFLFHSFLFLLHTSMSLQPF